ncbi:MAG: hypothetical protein HRT57_09915 [Crocinitomicaceae bacterium]|nr:hypothetical protein [Crocinitomicaceae bacterium]
MSKLKLLLGAFILCSFSLIAQDDFDGDVKWGEPLILKKKELGPYPIGVADDSFYSTKRLKKKTFLQTFGLKSLSLEKEVEMDFDYKGFDLTQISSFVFAEKVIFITSYVDKKAKKKHFLLHELENESALGKPIELAVTAWSSKKIAFTKKALAKMKEGGAYSFRFLLSEDYESMMVSYQNSDGDTETILFDKDLEEVGRTTMELPVEKFQVTSSRLTNSGRYYMVGYELKEGESKGLIKRQIEIAGDYHIYIHDAVSGDMEDIDLNIGKDIISIAVKVMDDESTVAYGMYSNEDAKGVSGAFFQKMSPKYEVEFTTLEEFEQDFITQHWTDRQKKKAEKKKKKKNPKKKSEPSLYSYIMHDLAVKDNGDLTLLAEQYYMYVTSHTYTDANGNSRTTYTYHYIYNDIIAVNCTNTGEVTWKQKVKKRQHSINDGGRLSSFYTMTQDNNIYLMYNDKEANMDDAEEATSMKDKRKQKKNTIAALIAISEDGDSKKSILFNFEGELGRTIVPKRCRRMGDKEVLLFAEMDGPKSGIVAALSKKRKMLGWLTLE